MYTIELDLVGGSHFLLFFSEKFRSVLLFFFYFDYRGTIREGIIFNIVKGFANEGKGDGSIFSFLFRKISAGVIFIDYRGMIPEVVKISITKEGVKIKMGEGCKNSCKKDDNNEDIGTITYDHPAGKGMNAIITRGSL